MEAIARKRFIRQSPYKIRYVLKTIKGLKVEDAINYGFNGFVVCSPAEDHYRTAVKILNKAYAGIPLALEQIHFKVKENRNIFTLSFIN